MAGLEGGGVKEAVKVPPSDPQSLDLVSNRIGRWFGGSVAGKGDCEFHRHVAART